MWRRSRPGTLGWCRRAWVTVNHEATSVTPCSSIRSSASAGSNRSWHTSVVPHWSAAHSTSNPPTQKNGIDRNVGPTMPSAVLRNTAPWVCRTPFGSAVDPDVWISTKRSAGLTSASTRSRRSSPTSTRSSTSTAVAHGRVLGPSTQIWRRYGSAAQRSRAAVPRRADAARGPLPPAAPARRGRTCAAARAGCRRRPAAARSGARRAWRRC